MLLLLYPEIAGPRPGRCQVTGPVANCGRPPEFNVFLDLEHPQDVGCFDPAASSAACGEHLAVVCQTLSDYAARKGLLCSQVRVAAWRHTNPNAATQVHASCEHPSGIPQAHADRCGWCGQPWGVGEA